MQLLPDDRLVELGLLTAAECAALEAGDRNFIRCPPAVLHIDREIATLGSPPTDRGSFDTEFRQIQLEPFLMQRTPVTNAQFELFAPSHRTERGQYSDRDNQPVAYVNAYEAEMFCIWLGGCRLPSEDEWEYACRAGTSTPFAVGDGQRLTAEDANFSWSVKATTDVGSYPANPWGLRDMHGNVWEWCATEIGSSRVLRGGSFHPDVDGCRSAYRAHYVPGRRDVSNGFRLLVYLS